MSKHSGDIKFNKIKTIIKDYQANIFLQVAPCSKPKLNQVK